MTKGNVIIEVVLSFLHPQNGLPGAPFLLCCLCWGTNKHKRLEPLIISGTRLWYPLVFRLTKERELFSHFSFVSLTQTPDPSLETVVVSVSSYVISLLRRVLICVVAALETEPHTHTDKETKSEMTKFANCLRMQTYSAAYSMWSSGS